MADIQRKIQEAASRNAELLEGLHETDSAPSQLHQQKQYLSDLEAQFQETQKRVWDLKAATKSELKDHKKYSESTFRRFAHKASGRKDKFEEKAAKEEREYFDAIQEQKTGEDALAYVKQLKAEGEITKAQYEAQVQRHAALQRELDALYTSIFSGPTPGFPEEDEYERNCNAAYQHVQDVNTAIERQRHLLFVLGQLSNKISEGRSHLHSAASLSTMDMFGGGAMISMQKHSYLERAESAMAQARMHHQQIQQLAPEMDDLGPMNVASGSIFGDVVFDNIFTDMAMHEKIKGSQGQIELADQKCRNVIKQQEGRVKEMQAELKEANMRVQEARAALQRVRKAAFQRVAAGEGVSNGGYLEPEEPTEALPAYTA